MMWMARFGTGIVPNKDVLNAAKRLRVTQDVEIELDRWVTAGPAPAWLPGPGCLAAPWLVPACCG
jgi:hypothetical protein